MRRFSGKSGRVTTFVLDGLKIIGGRVGVVNCGPLRLTRSVAVGSWELDLGNVPRDGIGGVIGTVTSSIYDIIHVFGVRIIMLLGVKTHEIRDPGHVTGAVVDK